MISFLNYKNAETGVIDWPAFHAAQSAERAAEVSSGRVCRTCRTYLVFGDKGYPELCRDCQALDSTEAVSHSSLIRCPHCGFIENVAHAELYDLHNDGEHAVTCSECNLDFQVKTSVSYRFESPERVRRQPETVNESSEERQSKGETQ